MSKAVLMSVKPKWCKLIANGKKTVEVRKTQPKIKTPFKVYIYCSKGKDVLTASRFDSEEMWIWELSDVDSYNRNMVRNGQIIGEFVCDFIEIIDVHKTDEGYDTPDCVSEYMLRDACLTLSQAYDYANGRRLYGWHISDPVIYNNPKRLREFHKKCSDTGYPPLDYPPQSWYYVEEIKD